MAKQTDRVLSVTQAREIVTEAMTAEVFEGPMPERADQVLETAGEIVWHAEQAAKAGVKDDVVRAILRIAADKSYFDPDREEFATNGAVSELAEPEDETQGAGPDAQGMEYTEGEIDVNADGDQVIFRDGEWQLLEDQAEPDDDEPEEGQFRVTEEGDEEIYLDGEWVPAPPEDEDEQGPVDEGVIQRDPEPEEILEPHQQAQAAQAEAEATLSLEQSRLIEEPADEPDEAAGKKAKADFRNRITDARRKAEAKIAKEHLPVPPDIDGEPPMLPRDISQLSDGDLRSLHGQFHACLSRVTWLIAVAEADHESATAMANDRADRRLREIEERSPKERTVSSIKAEAGDDDEIRELRLAGRELTAQTKTMKALRDVYDSTCSRISREMTFRSDERQSAAPPPARRG